MTLEKSEILEMVKKWERMRRILSKFGLFSYFKTEEATLWCEILSNCIEELFIIIKKELYKGS